MAKLTGHLMAKLTGHLQKEDLKEYLLRDNKRAVPAQLRTGPTRHSERARCKQCGHTWKAKDGTACYQCGHDGCSPRARPTEPTTPDHYRGSRIRNCPSCQTIERGYEDRCQHCGWERA